MSQSFSYLDYVRGNRLDVAPALASPSADAVEPTILRRPIASWKRILDLCGLAIVTPLAMPMLLCIAAYIRLVSRGPVLFVQKRVGHGGEEFLIYKFRTMHVPEQIRDASHRQYVSSLAKGNGPCTKQHCTTDLIPGGSLLRRLSIDEFPQLINVYRGEMSLVGPRPDLLKVNDYEQGQLRRFEVLPGMTGLWQVSGKNRLSFERMIELDIEYVESCSLKRDLHILAKTIFVLLLDPNE